MNDELILDELKELISVGGHLGTSLNSSNELPSSWNVSNYRECEKWRGAAINILKLRFGTDSDYYKDFIKNLSVQILRMQGGEYYKENVSQATGVLEYVYDALKKGLTDDLFYKKEIILLSNLLDQAFEFLNKNFKLAAAIYGRIVLETTIKEYAEKYNIDEKTFEQTIIELRKKGIIQKPFETSLRAHYQLGSDAVHKPKEFPNYLDKDIKEFLVFIRDKVLTLG